MFRFLLFALFISFSFTPNVYAFKATAVKATAQSIKAISKSSKTLPDNQIIELAEISSKAGGTKVVGQRLGVLKLSSEELVDAYTRIVIAQGRLSRQEAELMFRNLGSTAGFRTTLRKISGNNPNQSVGHLNELKIANEAAQRGFKPKAIGQKFNDGIKSKDTDIDVLLTKNNKTYAIEAKDYQDFPITKVSDFRADMDTLVVFKANNPNIIPIFSITRKPTNPDVYKALQQAADQRGVQLVVGNPSETITQIELLGILK